jgi:hypothetical protein
VKSLLVASPADMARIDAHSDTISSGRCFVCRHHCSCPRLWPNLSTTETKSTSLKCCNRSRNGIYADATASCTLEGRQECAPSCAPGVSLPGAHEGVVPTDTASRDSGQETKKAIAQ